MPETGAPPDGFPWQLDPYDPKGIVWDDGESWQTVADCATPGTARLILFRCKTHPVLEGAVRHFLAEVELAELEADPRLKFVHGLLRQAMDTVDGK